MPVLTAETADIGTVEDRNFQIRDFRLQNGITMPEVNIAYETYGRLAGDGRNAVLVTHGYTSSHHAAGRNPANGNQPGWWDGLIGPGKAIDTDRLYVVASNMLGSSYGSTNGASLDPATGKPYGSDFPAITVRDIVGAQKALLDSLGVHHLVAVAGPSYGGYQAFQWAVAYPDMMDAIAAVVTAPRSQNAEKSLAELDGTARHRSGMARRQLLRAWRRQIGADANAVRNLDALRLQRTARRPLSGQGSARAGDPSARDRLGAQLGRQLAGDPAPRHDRL